MVTRYFSATIEYRILKLELNPFKYGTLATGHNLPVRQNFSIEYITVFVFFPDRTDGGPISVNLSDSADGGESFPTEVAPPSAESKRIN